MLRNLLMLILAAWLLTPAASAQLAQGKPAPAIKAVDIRGQAIDLDAIIQQQPRLVILYFFSVNAGDEIAMKLRYLDMHYGKDKIRIVALGLQGDAAALKTFADRLGIKYAIIDAALLKDAPWLKEVTSSPLTLFVQADKERTIERVIVGGGAGQAQILKEVAENLYQQRAKEALDVANEAAQSGEDKKGATELKGFILMSEGKLDEAQKEFGAIDSKSGLAAVALEQGKPEEALKIADQAPNDAYARTVKAEALLKTGKVDEAAAALAPAGDAPAANWQKSEALNLQGRVAQQQGNADAAISTYKQAVALDPYNVVALSNEGAAHRGKGDLKQAEEVLQKASALRPDDVVELMLKQVQRDLKAANDVKRGELIRTQIAELSKRYAEMKQAAADKPKDDWTTRPLVMAFLPSPQQNVVFERAGLDVLLQREIEARLQGDERVGIVERQMLDQLLQELNLGSSELTTADTQRRLGQVLSAGYLGFIDFGRMGADIMMYVRLVDTETTAIAMQTSQPVDEQNPVKTVEAVLAELQAKLVSGRELQGLIADASDESAVLINLGKKSGVQTGQEFTVYVDGDPVEAGGKVIAHRQKPVAKLTVSAVEAEYAVCKVANKREGATLAKEMKIKAAK